MQTDNTPNYRTDHSRILSFKNFDQNVRKEKDELEKVDRSFTNNDDNIYNLPNKTKYKYNRVTSKMDDDGKDMIEDDIEAIEDMGIKNPDHTYSIEEGLFSNYPYKGSHPDNQYHRPTDTSYTNWRFQIEEIRDLCHNLLKLDSNEVNNGVVDKFINDKALPVKKNLEEAWQYIKKNSKEYPSLYRKTTKMINKNK